MSHGVPQGVVKLPKNGFVGNIGTSQVISWINIVTTATPANVFVYSYKGGTTAGNLIAAVDTADQMNHPVRSFMGGLFAQNGCHMATSANVSCVNIGYRSYAG
jgi:hypothetical protein